MMGVKLSPGLGAGKKEGPVQDRRAAAGLQERHGDRKAGREGQQGYSWGMDIEGPDLNRGSNSSCEWSGGGGGDEPVYERAEEVAVVLGWGQEKILRLVCTQKKPWIRHR